MSEETTEVSENYELSAVVGSQSGLHARPAAVVIQEAAKHANDITISTTDGRSGNLKSIISLIGLGINQGDEVTVSVSGENAQSVAEALIELIEKDLDSE
ncbi:MAG: HPr family phosphocarrier protein [Microbacteriaceae bacterium]|nr:HPr family phosphocarrier protein [Microbacteriaceae bacterium]